MSITRHNSVLSALEKRAIRYRNKGQQPDYDAQLYCDALDETGTVSTAILTDTDEDSISSEEGDYIRTAEQLERTEIREVDHELLKIHGVAPGRKVEGVTRMGYENPDGFNTIISNNEKLGKAKEIIDELELDVMAYAEHRINNRHKHNKMGCHRCSEEERPKYALSRVIMCMKTLVARSKGESVCYFTGASFSSMILSTLVRMKQALDDGYP